MVLLLASVGWVAPLKTSAQAESKNLVFKYESTTEPQVVYRPYKSEIPKVVKVVKTKSYCSCVLYARSLTGYGSSVGNARNWPKNVAYPVVGGVVITNESRAGHVGVITWVNGDTFGIAEANYSRCQKGTRSLNINNPVILGYWM